MTTLLVSLALVLALATPLVISQNGLTDMLNIVDAKALGEALPKVQNHLNEKCAQDMDNFLRSLEDGHLWALKAYDAFGRYSSGFFWGNSYWVGSETLCLNIGFTRSNYAVSGGTPNIQRNTSAPSLEQDSPIRLGFFKIRNLLKPPKSISPARTILLGMCLPYSCKETDVRRLLGSTISNLPSRNTSVTIERVKTPHEHYYFTKDPIFWILTCVSCVVYLFLLVGTMFDYLIEHRMRKATRAQYTNSSFVAPPEKMSVTTMQIRHDAPKFDDNSNTVNLMNSDQSSVTSEVELGVCTKVLLSFSIRKNLRTIWDQSVGDDTIPTVHGLRCLSMAWVIMGHTCIIIFKYSDNMEFRSLIEKEFFFQTISNAAYSVDSFFFISGLLVAFLYLRTTARIDVNTITNAVGLKSSLLQFFGLIVYRFCRLTAPYMFILGCVQVSMQYFQHNSVFDPPTDDHYNCPKYWWRNALYINTLFPVQEMCMLWSWYLADDSQFYVLGLVLLITAVSHFKIAAGMACTFLISSWITTAYVAYINNHMPGQDDPLSLFDKIYDKPWTRLGPYLIGMIVGWILFKLDCKLKMNKIVVCIGWLLSIGGLLALIYGLYEQDLDQITSSAYSSLSHSAWALCLAWVVIACSTGYGGVINTVLSSNILYPFSRVTYCAYLVHPLVIRHMIITLDSPFHLSTQFMMIMYLGVVSMSYIISFGVSLMFEAPVVSLLRIINRVKKPAD